MENLVIDIQNRLETLAGFKYVDEDNGQIDFYGDNPTVKFPCALVDVDQADWSNEARNIQTGLVTVIVRIATLKLTNSSKAAPQTQKDKARAILGLMGDVYKLLHGWRDTESDNYTKLIRTRTKRVKRDDGIREYIMTFTTQYYDESATPDRQKVKPQPDLRTEIDTTETTTTD